MNPGEPNMAPSPTPVKLCLNMSRLLSMVVYGLASKPMRGVKGVLSDDAAAGMAGSWVGFAGFLTDAVTGWWIDLLIEWRCMGCNLCTA